MIEKYFAKIENNIVTTVIVADFEFIQALEGVWLECGNDSGRNLANSNYLYIPEKDNFATQKPFESWLLNDSCVWVAPIPYPEDGKDYYWSENTLSWIEVIPYPEDGNQYYWNEETLTWELIAIIDNEEI